MASETALPEFVLNGFNYPRQRPRLPPGYNWETQIKKYCPRLLPYSLETRVPGCGYVFCHRGLYDRAMKVPENSRLAIENGIEEGLLLHEVDARIGEMPVTTFLAHDEVGHRVSSKSRKWTSLNDSDIRKTKLVMRRFDDGKNDLASSFEETEETVPFLENLLRDSLRYSSRYRSPISVDKYVLDQQTDGRCIQLDLRGDDFVKSILFFQARLRYVGMVLLKGYNFEFPSFMHLDAALASEHAKHGYHGRFRWFKFPRMPYVMMVFYSKPIIRHALREPGLDLDKAWLKAHSTLDFESIRAAIKQEVSSYMMASRFGPSFIPEIVHTGLGLGYNVETGEAKNPLDGTTITDPEVIFESCVDRAMIEVALEMRATYPNLNFSSCTRLCEVRKSSGEEWVADMKTGKLKPKPEGEKGASTKLRSIHGGLYPQAELVVADDPFAEIAARTWIDEYAELDRAELLRCSYSDWLRQAKPEIVDELVEAVNELNGPFLPNTYDLLLGSERNFLSEDAEVAMLDTSDNANYE